MQSLPGIVVVPAPLFFSSVETMEVRGAGTTAKMAGVGADDAMGLVVQPLRLVSADKQKRTAVEMAT